MERLFLTQLLFFFVSLFYRTDVEAVKILLADANAEPVNIFLLLRLMWSIYFVFLRVHQMLCALRLHIHRLSTTPT